MLHVPTTLLAGVQGSRYVDLELWLPFDETSGAQKDLSGNSYPTTISGATQGFAGKFGLACDFDGVNDTIAIDDAAILATFASSTVHTISFWAAQDAYNPNDAAVSINEDNTNNALAIYPYFEGAMAVQEFRVWYNGQYIFQVANSLTADGTYHHFCYVQRSATDHEFYIDGVSVATDATSKTIDANITEVIVGAYDLTTNEPFDGQVDNVKLWSRDLTDVEILDDFNLG